MADGNQTDGLEIITVRSARRDGRVALWEKDPAHPDGEIYVAGDAVVRVAKTPDVLQMIRDGNLVEVPGVPEAAPPAPVSTGKAAKE